MDWRLSSLLVRSLIIYCSVKDHRYIIIISEVQFPQVRNENNSSNDPPGWFWYFVGIIWIDWVCSIPSETPNEGLLPVHVYLDGISWKETFQVRIKDIFKKKYKGQKSIRGQIQLPGKSIQILISQKDPMYLWYCHILGSEVTVINLVKPTAWILSSLIIDGKNDIV